MGFKVSKIRTTPDDGGLSIVSAEGDGRVLGAGVGGFENEWLAEVVDAFTEDDDLDGFLAAPLG